MTSQSFLIVDDQPIVLEQALRYLQSCGKLGLFIGDILRQHIIEQEQQKLTDPQIENALVEQAIIDFRIQSQLTDPKRFQEWLNSKGIDYPTFHNQFAFNFKLDKLKNHVTSSKLQDYYNERKIFLDRVVLSRIIVDNPNVAEELREQIETGDSFEQVARENSLTEERLANGMMGAISMGTLPEPLQSAVKEAAAGAILGPLQVEGRWGLFRVEQFLPSSLEDVQVRQGLQNELFERWLGERLQKLNVKLQVS